MGDESDYRVRLHGKSPPPPWQKRSRWFPHVDAGDGLVLSAITLLVAGGIFVVLIVGASMGGSNHSVFLKALVVATSDGYALVDSAMPESMRPSGAEIGSFIWSRRSKSRGYFGPFEVVRWPDPSVMLVLHNGRPISPADAVMLASTAPNTLRGYSFDSPVGVTSLGSGDLRFRFKPGQYRFVWTGVALNIGFWIVLSFGFWTGSWFVFSLRAVLDPRRKRAWKLGEHLCPRCDYDVRLIESPRCPECGELLTIEPEERA